MADKGLFDKATGMVGDIWSNMSTLDQLALLTSPVPILGDVTGAVADGVNLYKDPNWTDAGLALTGLLPWVPPAVAARSVRQGVKNQLNKAVHHMPNYVPGFYSQGNPGTQKARKLGGVGFAGIQGTQNLAKGAYSPKAQGLWRQYGVSTTDQKVAKESLEKLDGSYKKGAGDLVEEFVSGRKVTADADKKAMGQINQSRQFHTQYGSKSEFYDMLDGLDQKAWADLSPEDYSAIMGRATGMKRNNLDAIFREISTIQGVDPSKNYRMAIRRTHTGASGNLIRAVGLRRILGGKTAGDLKKIFNGKPMKSNEELLAKLESNGVSVRNRQQVLENGESPIVTGSLRSDAYELGGVNYMTVIKKDGTLTSFMNDEHDLFALKAPMADRLIAVSTPVHVDLLSKNRRSKAVEKSIDLDRIEAQGVRDTVETVMSKIEGVDPNRPLPPRSQSLMSKAQLRTIDGLSNLDPDLELADYAAAGLNYLETGLRAGKPIERNTRDE